MSERQGIEIDYCPKCRGVWLDRGELDKLIDRAEPAPPQATASRQPEYRAYRKKRGGLLGELFDFD